MLWGAYQSQLKFGSVTGRVGFVPKQKQINCLSVSLFVISQLNEFDLISMTPKMPITILSKVVVTGGIWVRVMHAVSLRSIDSVASFAFSKESLYPSPLPLSPFQFLQFIVQRHTIASWCHARVRYYKRLEGCLVFIFYAKVALQVRSELSLPLSLSYHCIHHSNIQLDQIFNWKVWNMKETKR